GVLTISTDVSLPKPFLSRLPGCLDEAARMIRRALVGAGTDEPRLLNLVTHPTELVTQVFWDAVNFGGGRMPPATGWVPAPLRSEAEVKEAKDAFDRYVDDVSDLEGVEWAGIERVVDEWSDPARTRRFDRGDVARVAAAVTAQAEREA